MRYPVTINGKLMIVHSEESVDRLIRNAIFPSLERVRQKHEDDDFGMTLRDEQDRDWENEW